MKIFFIFAKINSTIMYKKSLIVCFLGFGALSFGQSVIQSVNSGSVIGTNSIVSVGEIIVTPQNNQQSSSGILGVLTQNGQLSNSEYNLQENITIFPNPTTATLHFNTSLNLNNEVVNVYDINGKLNLTTKITNNSIDLQNLTLGMYIIHFENKQYSTFKIIKK
jgi:Secretion system C-terminal sorting domain